MNRIDRLFGILLLLQARRLVRAVDIAAHYEISERTVYRDIAALMQLGVPIISQAGEGYRLIDGYFLPPLIFTPDEASQLFLGIKMLESSGNESAALASVREKISAVLPERTRRQAMPLVDAISFYFEQNRFDLKMPHLPELQSAIFGRHPARIIYRNWNSTETTERVIEPFRLMFNTKAWYVVAYCRLRGAVRSFRLERIEELTIQAETFSTQHDEPPAAPPSVEARVRFAESVLRQVRENQHYGFVEEADDGVMVYRVHHLDELKHWVFGWGSKAEALTPDDLRDFIRDEAKKLVSLLT